MKQRSLVASFAMIVGVFLSAVVSVAPARAALQTLTISATTYGDGVFAGSPFGFGNGGFSSNDVINFFLIGPSTGANNPVQLTTAEVSINASGFVNFTVPMQAGLNNTNPLSPFAHIG